MALSICRESYWTTLHENNRLLSVLTNWCCCQAIHRVSLYALQYMLKCNRRYMMTFVNDDHAIVLDKWFDSIFIQTRLDESYINNSMQGVTRRIKATYRGEYFLATTFLWFFRFLKVNVKKLRKTFVPLCKQGLGVNKN